MLTTSLIVIVLLSRTTLQDATTGISEATSEEEVGRPLLNRGSVTSPSAVPWHAGIWMPNGPRYDHLCGGTLIALNFIVTAAHCFWDLSADSEIPAATLRTYRAAVGKIYRDWSLDDNNPLVQRFNIQRVVVESRFDGFRRRQLEYDIALVQLAQNASLSEFVQVAGIDWSNMLPPSGSVGLVAGWGYAEDGHLSRELRSLELPYVDQDTCYKSLGDDRFKKLLRRDKFCAGFTNQGKSVCQGDSGGGFVTRDNVTNKPIVRGIVSLDFRPANYPKEQCYSLHYTGFTNIGEPRFLEWIKKILAGGTGKKCPPVYTSDTVQYVTCVHGLEYWNCSLPLPSNTVAMSGCKTGHLAGKRNLKTAICQPDGTWTNEEISCVRVSAGPVKCPAAVGGSAFSSIHCRNGSDVVNCSSAMSVGTTVEYTCVSGYHASGNLTSKTTTCESDGTWSNDGITCVPVTADNVTCPAAVGGSALASIHCQNGREDVNCSATMSVGTTVEYACVSGFVATGNLTSKTTTCGSDGTWSNDGITCVPECGRVLDVNTVRLHGEDVVDGDLPWNIVVNKRQGIGWEWLCSGTLISPTHVLTTAVCVRGFHAADLLLAARKHFRYFDPPEIDSQLRVARKKIAYEPHDENDHRHNIALLVANHRFVFSTTVNVACVDWSGQLQATPSDILTSPAIVQGSITSRYMLGSTSSSLLGGGICNHSIPSFSRHYVTEDKFCGRPLNNDACGDTIGGGLMHESRGQHFLLGVRSVNVAYIQDGQCQVNRVGAFVNVTQHLHWIRQHL